MNIPTINAEDLPRIPIPLVLDICGPCDGTGIIPEGQRLLTMALPDGTCANCHGTGRYRRIMGDVERITYIAQQLIKANND